MAAPSEPPESPGPGRPQVVTARPAGPPDPCYASPAWLVGAGAVTAGVLSLHDGRLEFVGDDTVVFDEPSTSPVAFPRFHRSDCLDVTVGGQRRRIRLTRPRHADLPGEHTADVAGLRLPDGPLGAPADGRRAGRVWRTLLATPRS